MSQSKLFLLFCVFLLSLNLAGHAAVFVVTNNANAGPGSLREALTLAAANGNTIVDNINFNLPGNTEADRTITLTTELPFFTSNIILDATTQPGANLGTSTAKIQMKADRVLYRSTRYNLGCFNLVNVINVEIYGFSFDQFYSLKTLVNPNGQSSEACALYIASSSGINIGAPLKGNVFIYNDIGVRALPEDINQNINTVILMQSNWFGLNLDGSESSTHKNFYAYIRADKSEIGGPTLSHGNIFGGFCAQGIHIGGTKTNVTFNRFGFTGDGNLGRYYPQINIGTTNGNLSDNLAPRFRVEIGAKNLKVLRNKELGDPTIKMNAVFSIVQSENVQIGSDDINDANVFLPSYFGPLSNSTSKNVEIRKNIIHCTARAYGVSDVNLPKIEVLINTDTEYSGIATPNSEVYIYNDYTDCSSCSPLQFYTKLITDAAGKWGITGDFTNNKFIANTTLVNTSSEYTQPLIASGRNSSWYISVDPTCGESNGSLEVANPIHLLKIEWYRRDGVKVGDGNKVTGLPAGEYYAKGYNGKCYTTSVTAPLINIEARIVTTNIKIRQPGCGKNNGSIEGLYYTTPGAIPGLLIKWVDENNTTISNGTVDLKNVGPGSYTFVATSTGNCVKTYGPVLLANTDGPNIDKKDVKIKNANCDNNDGKIEGVVATGLGNLKFLWKDENTAIVGQTADLVNAKAGKYILEVNDESTCGKITSTFEIVAENNLFIDETLALITKTTCGQNNGKITRLKVVGTTTFKWLNENNLLVGEDLDLVNVPNGKYKLTVSNAYCSKISSIFTIDDAPSSVNYVSTTQIKNASCNQNNGSISLNFPSVIPKSFKWVSEDNSATTIGLDKNINNLTPGFYRLYITDDNHCESLYGTFEVLRTAPTALNEAQVIVSEDQCGLKTGFIAGIQVSGGTLPYRYEWISKNGEIVGTALNLDHIGAGEYHLKVFDNENCSVNSRGYIVGLIEFALTKPEISPISICAPGIAIIAPNKISEGNFLLYKNVTDRIPLAKTANIFQIQVDKTSTYYVSYANGTCESARTMVSVEVGQNALNIANSFSPNNDGINDSWFIKGLSNYPEFSLKIFNRMGQSVFESRDPNFTFNGMRRDGILPIGVYYYFLNLQTGCPNVTGSLTLVR